MTALLIGSAAILVVAACPAEPEATPTHVVEGASQACPPMCTVDESIRIAANTYGVSYTRLNCLAFRESTWNPNARNGPYFGLMQFDMATWVLTPYHDYSPFNAWASANGAAYLISRGQGSRWPVWARGEC